MGQGAFGIIQLGTVGKTVFAEQNFVGATFETTIYHISVAVGFLLWSFGTWWFIHAIISTLQRLRKRIHFNMGWWGFIFPLGVYTTGTIALGKTTHLHFFNVMATMNIILLIIMWIMVAGETLRGAWSQRLFVAPCLSHMQHANPHHALQDPHAPPTLVPCPIPSPEPEQTPPYPQPNLEPQPVPPQMVSVEMCEFVTLPLQSPRLVPSPLLQSTQSPRQPQLTPQPAPPQLLAQS